MLEKVDEVIVLRRKWLYKIDRGRKIREGLKVFIVSFRKFISICYKISFRGSVR